MNPPPSAPPHIGNRVVWFFLFALPVAVLVTATTLTPNPHGHGTHTQLGLPPCGFYVLTGLPCPGCGLTTSFSFLVRGDVFGAIEANPFGVMLFLVSVSCAVVALVGLVKNLEVIPVLEQLQAERIALLLAAGSLVVWGVRIATMMASG